MFGLTGLSWFAQLAIGFALNLLAYLIMPKPPMIKPEETEDLEGPVASASMPVPVVFGTVVIKGLNTLSFPDKAKIEKEISI